MRLAGVVGAGVGDAEAAAEVDLGQFDAVLVADVLQQADDPVGGDLEAGHVEDLRPDVRVDPDQLQTVELERPPHGLRRLPAGQRDAELLVLVGGGDELVGVRLDAHGDPDLDLLPLAEGLGGVRDPHDLLEGVEHDPPDTGLDGPADLLDGLVVAVEGDALGGHPGGQRGGQFAAGAHVQVQPLLVQPPHDGPGQERLAGVEHIGVRTERGAPGTRAGAEVVLVQDVGGRAELLGEPGDRDPRDGDHAVVAARDGLRPHLPVQGVEVGGRRGVVPLGQDVGVAGPGGMGGTAHDVILRLSVSLRDASAHAPQRCSGASMPSRDRPPASTVPAASARASRARWAAEGFSSPTGSTEGNRGSTASATVTRCRASRSGARWVAAAVRMRGWSARG